MKNHESPFAKALFEWILVVAPVAVFVISEHMFVRDKRAESILYSAEWGIATGFLALLAIFLLLRDLPHVPGAQPRLGTTRIVALGLAFVLFGAYAVSIRILEVHQEGAPGEGLHGLVVWQWGMFLAASVAFVFIKHLIEFYEQAARAAEATPGGHGVRQARAFAHPRSDHPDRR